MSLFPPSLSLRQTLIADAAISGATGLLMAAGADLFAGLLGVPAALLRYAGMALIPFAALVGYLGTRDRFPPAAVWTVIAVNALWAAGSILLLASGWIAPTALGYAFVIAQAVVVGIFGELQYAGLRKPAAMRA
jgi:hypothetical protein